MSLLSAVVGLADDALVVGHRLSEWCGKAPFLEEDLAMSNTALDLLGRAQSLYRYAEQLGGRSEDEYAYLRDAPDFTNLLIYELRGADFAAAYARQVLVDAFDELYFGALRNSGDATLAGIAEQAHKEAVFHVRHSSEWLLRLGDGTDESHRRMQEALDGVWGYASELFDDQTEHATLVASGILPDRTALEAEWLQRLSALVSRATLKMPTGDWSVTGGREGVHTEHLGFMLAEMQHLPRTYPGAVW